MGVRLDGKVALVTGGAGGIGSATAELFLEEGAWVAIVDVDEMAVAKTFERLESSGNRLLPLSGDLTSEEEAERIVRKALDKFRRIDVLANVAAVRDYGPVTEVTPERWQRILGANLLSAAYCCKYVIPEMAKTGGGSIINVSSVNAVAGRKGMALYDATKAALLSLTRSMACDHAAQKVRVNAVCPGLTATDFHVRRIAARDGVDEDTARTILLEESDPAHVGLIGRPITPREIAYSILYLASNESAAVTGATFMIDGGLSV
ncbi:MAG: SDR family oxidoreductase [Chloroflexota bacterium]